MQLATQLLQADLLATDEVQRELGDDGAGCLNRGLRLSFEGWAHDVPFRFDDPCKRSHHLRVVDLTDWAQPVRQAFAQKHGTRLRDPSRVPPARGDYVAVSPRGPVAQPVLEWYPQRLQQAFDGRQTTHTPCARSEQKRERRLRVMKPPRKDFRKDNSCPAENTQFDAVGARR